MAEIVCPKCGSTDVVYDARGGLCLTCQDTFNPMPKINPCIKCGSTDVHLHDCGYSAFNVGGGTCANCRHDVVSKYLGCSPTKAELAKVWNDGNKPPEPEKKHRIVVCAAVLRQRTQTIPGTTVEETLHEIVMQLRAPHKTYGANTWFLPGGKVEWGESIAKATARELKEELGITVRPEDVVNLGMKEVIREGAHDIMVYVLVEKFEGELTNLDVKNTTRIDWFDVFIWKRLAEEYPFHEPMDVLTRITDYVNFKEYQKSSSEECFLCW